MKTIITGDLGRHYKSIKKEIDIAVKRVLRSSWYILGKEVENFESELGKFLGIKHVVGVASGTDALTIALKALDLKKDDEVILPANSYPTAFGVYHAGAKIKLADVDPETLNLNVDTIKKATTKKTKAIVVVHLYGNPGNLSEIKKFTKENKLFLIEDCAQSIGAEFNGKKTGSFGDIACFSFYPTKNLGAFGDGGAIVTNSHKLFNRIKLLRNYGEQVRYNSILIGHNSRLDELQAAILRVKLKNLNNWNNRRREIAKKYLKSLDKKHLNFVNETKGGKSVYHLFVVRSSKRNELVEYLKDKGINVGVHYPVSISQTKSFKSSIKGSFAISEKSNNEILSLPVHPELQNTEVDFIIKSVNNFFK